MSDVRLAQEVLARWIDDSRAAVTFGVRPDRTFRAAAAKYLDQSGFTGLQQAPHIKLLPAADARAAYPLSFEEQSRLPQELSDHLLTHLTTHHSAPERTSLIAAAERVCATDSRRKSHAIVVFRPKAAIA